MKSFFNAIEEITHYISYKVREQLIELYKGLSKNPRWLLMRYLSRFTVIRYLMRKWSVRARKSSLNLPQENTIFDGVDIDVIIKTLRYDGFYTGLSLPPNWVKEILDFAHRTPCYANRKQGLSFYYDEKDIRQFAWSLLTGYYFNTAISCRAIKQLEQDPLLWQIAACYFQAQPKHIGNQLWWSFANQVDPHKRHQAAQSFHYDLDDCLFLKFFFYITDVELTNGPHVVVRGSHRQKPLLHQLRRRGYTDVNIEKVYGKENIKTICGGAGFGFVEDPLCFHKGAPPIAEDRLILQIEFALHDYGMQKDLSDHVD